MPDRQKIFILTPNSIEKARRDLAELNKSYSYLVSLCEDKSGILEFELMELGFMFWLTRGKHTLDEIVKMITDGIAYYESLNEHERQLDPPLRLSQPDSALDQVFCDQPKMATSYCPPDGPHPYIMMMFGRDELETDLPLFILMDAKRREEGLKILPKLKAHRWSKKQFNEPLAEALSAIGLYLEIHTADEFAWFVKGLETSLSYAGHSPPEGHHLATCHTSDPTNNKVGKIKHHQVQKALQLKEQLEREAAFMRVRFYERRYVFSLGDVKLTLRHQWDIDAVIAALDHAIVQAKRPSFVEKIREFFN